MVKGDVKCWGPGANGQERTETSPAQKSGCIEAQDPGQKELHCSCEEWLHYIQFVIYHCLDFRINRDLLHLGLPKLKRSKII